MANNNPRTLCINHQAINIIEDYFTKVSQNPTHVEREVLLEKIKAVPNCEGYDMARLTSWFLNRRKRMRLKERALQHSDNTNDSRFPSLTPAAIQHLTVLSNSQPNPPSELLKTWTALLASSGAKEQDVINWTHHRNQEQQLQRLPTPSDTTSMTPEPSSSTSQSPAAQSAFSQLYKQETITSPVVPTLQLPFYEHEQATPPEPSPTSSSPSNDDPMPLRLNQYSQVPVLQAIIHGVRDALASSHTAPTTAAPKSAAEFEAMFSPFEQRMSLLLLALEST